MQFVLRGGVRVEPLVSGELPGDVPQAEHYTEYQLRRVVVGICRPLSARRGPPLPPEDALAVPVEQPERVVHGGCWRQGLGQRS